MILGPGIHVLVAKTASQDKSTIWRALGYVEYDPSWGEAIQRRLAAIAYGSVSVAPHPAARQQLADHKMREELGEALDAGIAELDTGQGIESSIDELMAEIDAAVGLAPVAHA